MNIPKKPINQKLWVIRSEAGRYLNNFIKSNIVAIGHLDGVQITTEALRTQNHQDLANKLRRANPDATKASITSHTNQTYNFINEVNIGDMVITLNSSVIYFGLVQGTATIDETPSVVITKDKKEIVLPYKLRREVKWERHLPRAMLQFGVEKTLQAHQTIFNIDTHWEQIYHTIYPFFTDENNNLYSSFYIGKKNAISNYEISQFFNLLNNIEILSRLAANKEVQNFQSFSEAEKFYKENYDFEATTKAEFASPGSIWSAIPFIEYLIPATLLIALISGGKIKIPLFLDIELNGILDKETKFKLIDLFVDMCKTNKVDQLNQSLNPTQPSNTKEL